MSDAPVMWTPDPVRRNSSALHRFISALRERGTPLPASTDPDAFRALHQWSIDEPGAFWRAVWHDAEVIGSMGEGRVLDPGKGFAPPSLDGPRWFPEARLNF